MSYEDAYEIAKDYVTGDLFTMLPLFGPAQIDIERIIVTMAKRFSDEG